MKNLKLLTKIVLILVIAICALLLYACDGSEPNANQDERDGLTYGDVMGEDVDELYAELENG